VVDARLRQRPDAAAVRRHRRDDVVATPPLAVLEALHQTAGRC
jgi:hypothetical protein